MKVLLAVWQANHDIQFVLDPYQCVTYICDYMMKAQKGMSDFLCVASEEAKAGNMDVWQSVHHIGNKFLNAVEEPIQAACYSILQLPFLTLPKSLNLNHLIDWEFLFGNLSNLDSRHHMTSPRTLFGQFWHTSIFGNSRAIRVICQNQMPSENQFFFDEGVTRLQSVLGVLGGQVPRLYGGTILGGCNTLRGSSGA